MYQTIKFENVAIKYPNFSGRPTQYNPQGGKREFNIVVPNDVAESLAAEGWNIKTRLANPNDLESAYYIMGIKVSFMSRRPPQISVVSDDEERNLDEDSVGVLDGAYIESADLFVNGSDKYSDRTSGYKNCFGYPITYSAYLERLRVHIKENRFSDEMYRIRRNHLVSNNCNDLPVDPDDLPF